MSSVNHSSEKPAGPEALFEAVADPVFVIDFTDDGLADTFRYVNAAACALMGRSREELLRTRPGIVDEIPPSVRDAAYERLVTEGRATFESLLIDHEGGRIPVELHASDALIAGQRVCIAVARSLVARKETERLLREARDAADAANRAKSEFLATMSHEIRTPLHGVIGFASLLDDGGLPEDQREIVAGIRDSADLLLALVTDVLDLSRIDAGQLELQPIPVDLPELLRRLETFFRLRTEQKGLVFRYVEAPGLPAAVIADATRIRQVLGNLLGNALKFTDAGGITLEVRTAPADDGHAISFLVADTGIGIRDDQRERLFQPFSQVDSSAARRHGGSGLGLVIVRRLCELMGGAVTVESGAGGGSLFTATVRVRSAPADVVFPPRIEDLAPVTDLPRRILVAEDNPTNLRILARMLESLGCSAEFAADGSSAVARAAASPFELILMDVNMPGLTGLDATRAIREGERSTGRAAARIVALTAGVSEAERQACLAAGMDSFLGKPFTRAGLRAVLTGSGAFVKAAPQAC